ncbi:MAG: sulfatase-like hydrolase/transferase, partial [Candidatus Omnitrophica bacterium]|nr:sulfatase-like hydrolase/transferase [Candidatus Omnitrophota bacterium]
MSHQVALHPRRLQLRLLFFTAWLISSTAYFFQAPCPAAPPNVLLIMSDDQGWGDIHSHGNDKIDTPVLDRLASEGIRFDRFFVSPVCAPTRAS